MYESLSDIDITVLCVVKQICDVVICLGKNIIVMTGAGISTGT